jgi:hypothetical protein
VILSFRYVAGLRQRDAAGRAAEQLKAKAVLELFDGLAERRPGDA